MLMRALSDDPPKRGSHAARQRAYKPSTTGRAVLRLPSSKYFVLVEALLASIASLRLMRCRSTSQGGCHELPKKAA